MMLRNKKMLRPVQRSTIKKKTNRNKKLSEGQDGGKVESISKRRKCILHCSTGLPQEVSHDDCISGVWQLSTSEEHSTKSWLKNSRSLQASISPLPNCNQIVGVVQTSPNSRKKLANSSSNVQIVPIEMRNAIDVTDYPARTSLTSHTTGTPNTSSSDIIVLDSPSPEVMVKKIKRSVSQGFPQFLGTRKRKHSEESGIEILYDIPGRKLKKQCSREDAESKNIKRRRKLQENYTVTLTGIDRKVSPFTKGVETEVATNIINDMSSSDADVIFVDANDEVSVIDINKQCELIEDDVIVLDSPAKQALKQNPEKEHRRVVSASKSVTGLIPHYTQNLIDFIPLNGQPAAVTPNISVGRDRKVVYNAFNRSNVPTWRTYANDSRARSYCHSHALQHNFLANPHNSVPVHNYEPAEPPLIGRQHSTEPLSVPQSQACAYKTNIYNKNSHVLQHNSHAAPLNSVPVHNSNHAESSLIGRQHSTKPLSVSQSPACAYGTNIYNPNANAKEESGLRPIIIDGSNIALGHGKGKFFSWQGLHICIKYFLKRGHKVTAFVPTFRRGNCPPELRTVLEDYEKNGQVVFTPSRRIDGRLIVPYDDRFIIQCAAELGGVVVSTDNFRDLLSENDSWKETIQRRLLMFSWVGDLLMFPHDPLGRDGPQLEDFLQFPKK